MKSLKLRYDVKINEIINASATPIRQLNKIKFYRDVDLTINAGLYWPFLTFGRNGLFLDVIKRHVSFYREEFNFCPQIIVYT